MTTRTSVCTECSNEIERAGRGRLPATCSPSCRKAREARVRKERLEAMPPCEAPGCDKLKRSSSAQWCEMHYARLRQGGSLSTTRTREYTGACYHCGAPCSKRQRLFCSDLCRRRHRMGASGRELTCVVCSAKLPEEARLDAMFCSNLCLETHERGKRYGLSGQELLKMLEAQSACSICGKESDLVVDHCHVGGEVRGLLCSNCNVGLGMFADNPEALEAAARYIRRARGLGDEQSAQSPSVELAEAA